MKSKTLLAGVVAGIAFFVWGFLWWAASPLSKKLIPPAPGGAGVMESLKAADAPAGVYLYPSNEVTESPEGRGKPRISLLIYAQVPESMGPAIGKGIAISVLLGLLLATFASCTAPRGRGFGGRVMFCVMMGLIYCLAGPLVDWNWFGWPGAYLAFRFGDILGGFLVMGLVIGALVKPCDHPQCAKDVKPAAI